MPLNAWKNSERSSSTSTPVIRRSTENIIEVPRPKTFIPSPVGCMNTWSARPSMNCISRLGASRKSSALRRRRRVEDEQVVAVLGVELEELLHRHVLLRAGERVRELLVDAVGEDAVPRLGVRGVRVARARRRSPSRRASWPTARRRWCRSRRPRRASGRPVAPRCRAPASPSESASRFAGSIVSTATFLPRAAIPAAIAAELVVLPTPPEPAQMQTRLPSSSSRDAGHQPIASASSRISSTPSSGSKTKGRVRTGASTSSASRASCSRWAAARRVSLRAARQAARRVPLPFDADRLQALGLVLREALGVERVHVDAVDRHAHVLGQRALERRGLVDRHLLGQRDDRDAGLAVVDEEGLERLGLGLDRPDAGDVGERPRASGGRRRRARSPARRRSRGRTCAPFLTLRSG